MRAHEQELLQYEMPPMVFAKLLEELADLECVPAPEILVPFMGLPDPSSLTGAALVACYQVPPNERNL